MTVAGTIVDACRLGLAHAHIRHGEVQDAGEPGGPTADIAAMRPLYYEGERAMRPEHEIKQNKIRLGWEDMRKKEAKKQIPLTHTDR
jgi:hypothetical protein